MRGMANIMLAAMEIFQEGMLRWDWMGTVCVWMLAGCCGGFRSVGEVEMGERPAMPIAEGEELESKGGCGDQRFAGGEER